ncbi:MAG: HlyD family secretion protein [Planctomycetota bacterium]
MKVNNVSIRRGGRLRTQLLPVLVWLAVLGCVVALFRHRTRRFEVVGLAQAELYQVAATCTGRLREVPVQLFEKVDAGQTLAVVETVLDNEHVEAELEVARAEIHHLQAQLTAMAGQLQAEAANLDTDQIAATRRYAVDVEAARLRILEFKTQLETDRMTLRDLALEVETARRRTNCRRHRLSMMRWPSRFRRTRTCCDRLRWISCWRSSDVTILPSGNRSIRRWTVHWRLSVRRRPFSRSG